jgi:hypothetical protein
MRNHHLKNLTLLAAALLVAVTCARFGIHGPVDVNFTW